ncbi:MAG: hypothetical protein ABI175_01275 [Polyangiales bacterium]
MTTEPDDKVRRPIDPSLGMGSDGALQVEPASAREGDAPASSTNDIDGPRRSRGSISGSLPAVRGPRDRGRRD